MELGLTIPLQLFLHLPPPDCSADYQILVEADFLVYLFEGNHPADTQREVYRRIFKTEGGKKLFRSMFVWE